MANTYKAKAKPKEPDRLYYCLQQVKESSAQMGCHFFVQVIEDTQLRIAELETANKELLDELKGGRK